MRGINFSGFLYLVEGCKPEYISLNLYDSGRFFRRYRHIEDEFLEILDFIEISDNFNDPCYKIGSSKLMEFCLNVGSEIETLFREMFTQHNY